MIGEDEEYLPPPYLFKKSKSEIDKDHPWEKDLLDRKKVAKDLNKIIQRVNQPMVMTITAPYGMGKTTFLECWKAELQNDGASVVMFNAWETDFSKDAFVAFVSAIENQFSSKSDAKAKFINSAKKLGGALVKNAPSLATKVITKAAIGESGVKALENLNLSEDDAVKFTEALATEAFKNQKISEKSVSNFKTAFEDIVKSECNGKLFVFIDELDRCRPKYAVDVLESVKHVFSVPGVIFVLAVDDDQLVSSFKGVYGPDLNAKGYFAKFVDWSFKLPEPPIEKYTKHLSENIFEFEEQALFTYNNDDYSSIWTFYFFLDSYSKVLNLSPRDLGRCFTYVNMAMQLCKGKAGPNEIAICAFLKSADKDFYNEMLNFQKSGSLVNGNKVEHFADSLEMLGEEHYRMYDNDGYWLRVMTIEFFAKLPSYGGEPIFPVSDNYFSERFPEGSRHTKNDFLEHLSGMRRDRTKINFGRGSAALEKGCL